MALQKNILIDEIRKINDESFEDFIGWGSSYEFYCNKWAECIKIYCSDIIPISTTLEQAKISMMNFLISSGNVRGRVFEDSIQKFASELIIGMQPIWNGIMPTIQLDLSQVYEIGLNGGSSFEVAQAMAEKVHSWFLQGTAINVNTGATINWS